MCLAWFWHKFLYRIFLCFLETISHINRATRTMKKRHVLLLIFAFIAISIYAQNASAKINSVWVTHNVSKMQNVWNGWTWVTIPVNGMEIHTNFDINECRAQKIRVCMFVYEPDGRPTESYNSQYRSPDGQLTIQEETVPNYANTNYGDFKLFMPYSEFNAFGQKSYKFCVTIMKEGINLAMSDWVYFTVYK